MTKEQLNKVTAYAIVAMAATYAAFCVMAEIRSRRFERRLLEQYIEGVSVHADVEIPDLPSGTDGAATPGD